ncbi:Fanconi anemia group F protein [Bufo gargarizans]|uniref:Fanconi anemia group F protein n=1 Tax=Bufo gargarizans TaxID=30331 RepID=UPI001CF54EA9|nr:Fanconi anemia group F protein [Bufo gargarizans]XP_044161871.1 Fanconi anemia group F protein [Bufo gargarizans]XP_044161872.1 Fanconi anemia group F protein [Bufo gargarizans]XP_044161873.1 Fanconi anemia group F protein [Bufo gargarizans]XP_044161874.1 Fanconi anemia group F protein [Bufo gargarizans]
MAGKLKTLLDNLDQFIEVLALSPSAHAKDWDILHVQRALEWGTYFEHVHHRYKANNSLRNSIEAHLTAKNQELSCCMKNYHDITFDDLGKGRDILCMSLLQNKSLPDPVFKYVTELLRNSDTKGAESTSLTHYISQKVASELLLSLPLLASKGLQEPLDNPVLMTQAELLRSSLEGRLKVSEDNQKSSIVSHFLGRISKPHVYHLVEAVLLSNDALDSEHQNLLSDLLLDWVLSNDDLRIGFFLNVKCQGLARLSFMSSRFRHEYMDHLEKLGSSMEPDVNCGKWVSDTFRLSFEGLLDHYKHLMEGPAAVKDSILTKLRALKCQDGNYDVPGIRIWTDVLAEIHET